MQIDSTIIINALKLIMRPIVAFCIRHSLRIQDLTEIGKSLFVELAAKELEKQGMEGKSSRISVVSGLHRRDVMRFMNSSEPIDKAQDVISKVIGQWQNDKRFTDSKGSPKPLSYGFEKSDFTKLVRLISNDTSASSVMLEMGRIKSIETKNDKVTLILGSYIPKGNPMHGFKILSDDIEDLRQAVEDNVFENATPPNMHFRTVYDRIDPKAKKEIDLWLLEQGQELHLRARQFLSKFDLDINPNSASDKKPLRVALSSFSLIKESEES